MNEDEEKKRLIITDNQPPPLDHTYPDPDEPINFSEYRKQHSKAPIEALESETNNRQKVNNDPNQIVSQLPDGYYRRKAIAISLVVLAILFLPITALGYTFTKLSKLETKKEKSLLYSLSLCINISAGVFGGMAAGMKLGMIIGAILGSVIPGAGTAGGALVGAIVGACLGCAIGALVTKYSAKKISALVNKNELVPTNPKKYQPCSTTNLNATYTKLLIMKKCKDHIDKLGNLASLPGTDAHATKIKFNDCIHQLTGKSKSTTFLFWTFQTTSIKYDDFLSELKDPTNIHGKFFKNFNFNTELQLTEIENQKIDNLANHPASPH